MVVFRGWGGDNQEVLLNGLDFPHGIMKKEKNRDGCDDGSSTM